MKKKITKLIKNFIKEYERQDNISTRWGDPLVGFADANDPYILNFKGLITPTHKLPTDVLSDASIVIAYFVPFTKELAKTNGTPGDVSSPEWALAYEETNAMFVKLNEYMISELRKLGYHADISPEASTFDQKILKSNWSHRHFAKAAGLGTFGINNMLITSVGCCGRYNTIVTNLDVKADSTLKEELCLYKKNGSCGVCVKHCPSGALTLDGYDRHKCYVVLMKNAELYTEFGSSYTDESGDEPNSIGSEVCGKCVVNTPCTFFIK
ncbi:epoxyqueuosine reductase [Clostridium beijerinckii]|uniref:Epoxyqueuosine reductase n=2 Tax=Clostridium beijerinckii TaxID=1520 RepID=A0AB74VBD9_CLOBE|nr:epoxyqueuosine reductase [Clostridium beijerinckii]MBC2460357.1 epoxyqueuosine reductase [Clostridium beijerinckii]MBC2477837.1 epoxyqueuosine reductase [Clostridium beijerinckii]NOV61100.1 epoxyqueuosine reductase QueG [Clostridium beijerinckii]NOV69407.1 epoxyqueuosine reductase QueG [Clostridium beijerinckii]NOW33037.1 epoxyqueuosine reductase QueG [Clostridium beijerinckii]